MTSPNNAVNTTLTGQSGTGAFAGTANTTFTGKTVTSELLCGSATGPQTSAAGTMQAVGVGAAGQVITSSYINNAGSSPTVWHYKSRSAVVGSFATVQTADTLGRELFFADDGTSFVSSAAVIVSATGAVSTGIVPGQYVIQTANSSGSLTSAVTINSAQQTNFAGLITSSNGINFGGTTLGTYTENTFLPTFTCATPGDLSVSYATQNGYVTRIGRMAFVQVDLVCTPTFTTASGQIRVSALPFTVNSTAPLPIGGVSTSSGFVYVGTPTTSIIGVPGQVYANIRLNATASNGVIMLMSNITTGAVIEITFTLAYLI